MSNDAAFDQDVWAMGLQASTDAQRAIHGGVAPEPPGDAYEAPTAPQAEAGAQLPEAPCSVTARVDFHGSKDVLLTFRGMDGRSTLSQLARALDWIRSMDVPATMPVHPSAAQAAPPAYSAPQAPAAPGVAGVCPTHGVALKQSKHRAGEWYCPHKISDDDGTGKASYCRFKTGA